MQTMTQPIQWGNLPLILDHPTFEAGYTRGRQYFFDEASDEEEHTEPLTTERLLTLIAVRDTMVTIK